jgi:hypothetical protein
VKTQSNFFADFKTGRKTILSRTDWFFMQLAAGKSGIRQFDTTLKRAVTLFAGKLK